MIHSQLTEVKPTAILRLSEGPRVVQQWAWMNRLIEGQKI